MAPGNSGGHIVRSWHDPHAPTGEGARYQTADGTVWEEVLHLPPRLTGDRHGWISKDRIDER